MPTHRFVLCSALCLVALPGCSDSDRVGVEGFKNAYPEAYCARHFRCCAASQSERLFPSATNCESTTYLALEELLEFADDPAAQATFREDLAGGCLSQLGSRDCSTDGMLSLNGCMADVVQPRQSEGEPCMFSIECDSYYCVKTDPDTPGTCGAAGSSGCSGDHRACGDAAYCNMTQCQPKQEPGALCAVGAECQSGLCSPDLRICVNTPTPRCDGA